MPARPARRSAAHPSARAAGRPPTPAPPAWRDVWAWASALSVLPLLARCAGAPLGEPVAEDFDFLHRVMFHGMGSLLDGGGSQAFWRPLTHQLYYASLGGLLVSHPLAVAALHAVLLALGAWVWYRALRPAWSGPLAAVAASFPLLAESTRTLVGWPSHFIDLSLFVCSALAVHEATRRRLATALVALAAALLSKEPAVVTALLLPLVPGLGDRRERVRWAVAVGALTLAWGGVYLWVRRHAHLELPHGVGHAAALAAAPWTTRLAWAFGGSLKAISSLTLWPGPHDGAALGCAVALLALVAVVLAVSPAARSRLVPVRGWTAWGLAWFALATLTLTAIYPLWQPNRSQFASVGLGIALAALLGAAHPVFAGLLVGGRLVLLGLAPGPAATIAVEPPTNGAFMDFQRLTRLQRFAREMRLTLHARFPTLPRGASVVQQNLPHAVEYALGGDKALRVWYRDSTLRWLRFESFSADSMQPVAGVVDFQPGDRPELVVVGVDAVREQLRAVSLSNQGRWTDALVAFDRADSLLDDPHAVLLRAHAAAQRAYCLFRLGRVADAEREARRGMALRPNEVWTYIVLGAALAAQGRFDEADAQIDSALLLAPDDRHALLTRATIRRLRLGSLAR